MINYLGQNFFKSICITVLIQTHLIEIPTAQDILETLLLPQYYMIEPPGNPDIHVLYPRRFIVPHAN